MSVSEPDVGTPHYVLMDGDRRIGPNVLHSDSGCVCSSIYGFSDMRAYGKFWMDNEQGLKPYPLVRGFLQNQNGASGNVLKLVVIDAAGPCEPCIQAATAEAVLEALEKRTTRLTVAYQLIFDQEADAYRVEEASV